MRVESSLKLVGIITEWPIIIRPRSQSKMLLLTCFREVPTDSSALSPTPHISSSLRHSQRRRYEWHNVERIVRLL